MFAVKPRTLVKTDARLPRRELDSRDGTILSGQHLHLPLPSRVPSVFSALFKFSPSTVDSIHADVAIRLVGEHARTLLAATATKPTRFASRPPTASPKIVE